MDIFESLENLNVSEGCFNEIISIVEEVINELKDSTVDSAYVKRMDNYKNAEKAYKEAEAEHDKEVDGILKKYTTQEVIDGKADKEVDAADKKIEPFHKALKHADDKWGNIYNLYKKRQQRKQL